MILVVIAIVENVSTATGKQHLAKEASSEEVGFSWDETLAAPHASRNDELTNGVNAGLDCAWKEDFCDVDSDVGIVLVEESAHNSCRREGDQGLCIYAHHACSYVIVTH